MRNRRLLLVLLLAAAAIPATVNARSRHRNRELGVKAGEFDYYLLALSWAPSWCAQDASRANSTECAADKHVGFIVHGFWPQSVSGSNPENCGQPGHVPQSSIKVALPLMLSTNLIQHEWATHGTCSGLNPYDYFTAMAQARSSVQIPVQLISAATELNLSPSEIEAQFVGTNRGLPKDAVRVACMRGTMEEVRVCFDKNLKARSCAAALNDCRDALVKIPPTV
jgi:ribonuclease T2